MASATLNERTLNLLINRPRTMTYSNIAVVLHPSNPKSFETWLRSYVNGRLTIIPVDNVQAIYEFLSGKPLFND